MSGADDQYILHEEALDELYTWIDTIPVSRPRKNIARDFSDGVLCAEIVAYYSPKNVDMHNYFPASSVMQKKINWNTLNRKVFAKLGIRLTENTIQQLIEAKPGAIEMVLWDMRRKLHAESVARQEYRNSRRMEAAPPAPRARSVGGSPYDNDGSNSIGYRPSTHDHHDYSDEPQITFLRGASKIPMCSGKPPATSPGTGGGYQGAYSNSYQGQGYISAARASPSHANTEATNNNPSLPPSQIIYRGHKMVPLGLLEEREREIKSLEAANKTLVTKVNRVETLVSVKDQRIEDLTHQLHNVRTMYERATQQTWSGF